MTPKIYYHESPTENRASILEYGLHTRFSLLHEDGDDALGLTFVTDVRPETNPAFDIWEIDGEGLTFWEDSTTEPPDGENWYCTGSIPVTKIRLSTEPEPKRASRISP